LTNLPSPSPVIDIEAAGGAQGTVFAITANGEAWSVGYSGGSGGSGQTGLGTSNQTLWKKVVLPASCIKVRATGSGAYGHTLWLLSDGRVFAAGYNGYGQTGTNPPNTSVTGNPVEVTGLTGITSIWAMGGQFGCSFASRSSDSAFFAWGCNNFGQLGLGDQNHRSAPTQSPRYGIVSAVGASQYNGTDCYTHTVLLDTNGNAYASGYNGYGQCGVGYASANVLTHKLIQLPAGVQGTLIQVGTMGYHSYTGTHILDTRGRVWACGYHGGYMLGLGDTNPTYQTLPQRVNF